MAQVMTETMKASCATVKNMVGATMELFPKFSLSRPDVIQTLKGASGMSTTDIAESAKIPIGTVHDLQSSKRTKKTKATVISSMHAQKNLQKKSFNEAELRVFKTWLFQEASPKSGATRDQTLYMDQTLTIFYARYRALSLSMLISEAMLDTMYCGDPDPNVNYTLHEKNVWAAKWMSEQIDFDEHAVVDQRIIEEMEALLAGEGVAKRSLHDNVIQDGAEFDPSSWVIRPRVSPSLSLSLSLFLSLSLSFFSLTLSLSIASISSTHTQGLQDREEDDQRPGSQALHAERPPQLPNLRPRTNG